MTRSLTRRIVALPPAGLVLPVVTDVCPALAGEIGVCLANELRQNELHRLASAIFGGSPAPASYRDSVSKEGTMVFSKRAEQQNPRYDAAQWQGTTTTERRACGGPPIA